MNSNSRFIFLVLLSYILWIQTSYAQHKFELGIYLDPLILPVNSVTFIEDGPGYYDINGRVKIAQALGANFSYWPFKTFGFSAGMGLRNFKTQIDYSIPDPINDAWSPIIEGSYPFSATGWGPLFALHWRKDKWQASIGFAFYTLTHQEYQSRSGIIAVSTWDEFGVKIADIQMEEEAFWGPVPYNYDFLQVEVKYYFSTNFFVKFGFENTGKSYWYPYTARISGYVKDKISPMQILNDYKMNTQLIAFSVGVGTNLGFGKYKTHKNPLL